MFARLCGRQVLPEPTCPVNPNERLNIPGISADFEGCGGWSANPGSPTRGGCRVALTARRIVAAALLAAAVGGCGKAEPPAATVVKGSVTFQGRPLAGGLVVFAPDREKGNPGKPLTATIGPDGWYRLTVDGSPAVTPGWYRVAIADPPEAPGEEFGRPRFPAALRRPDRSGLDREVLAGRENVFHFEIEVTE